MIEPKAEERVTRFINEADNPWLNHTETKSLVEMVRAAEVAALEKAAKVADEFAEQFDLQLGRNIAAAIRQLKE